MMKVKLRPMVLGVASFLIVAMSIFHIFFSSVSDEYLAHKKTHKLILKERDSKTIELLNEFNEKVKSIKDNKSMLLLSNKLLKDYKNHYKESKIKLKNYNDKKRKLVIEHSFRGRSSFHFWLFIFGLVTALLFFSCKSLYDDIVKGSAYKFQFLSLTGIAVSFFWLIHLFFFTQKDFSQNSYVAFILLCAILSTFFVYFLVKNYTYKDDIILKQLSLIDRIKTIHYPKIAIKALYSERNDRALNSNESVEDNTNAFDKDILVTLNNI
ncbi:hypothetical protein [Tenacibaculum sp. 190524A02b]|uniref:hypothetical protein n=1 Tax=Tenacibaculum vairaonense TaxID=3137860 RepID=UPI0032B212B3